MSYKKKWMVLVGTFAGLSCGFTYAENNTTPINASSYLYNESPNLNDFKGLKSLSDDSFSYVAEQSTRHQIVQNGEVVRNSLVDINQQQVNYNIASIENMQSHTGSGIYFRQTRNSARNSQEDSRLSSDAYQNIVSGKFAIDAENSLMASVNEGQNTSESLRLFNGKFAEATTKLYGISVAYNKKVDDVNLFAFVGKNWIENKLQTESSYSGYQTHIGLGANYKVFVDKFSVTPQMNLQWLESSLQPGGSEIISAKAKQTTATLSLKSVYKVNESFNLGAAIDYEKDLIAKNTVYVTGAALGNGNIPSERYGMALSVVYKPIKKMDVVMDYKYNANKAWKDDRVNIGVRYNF